MPNKSARLGVLLTLLGALCFLLWAIWGESDGAGNVLGVFWIPACVLFGAGVLSIASKRGKE